MDIIEDKDSKGLVAN